MGLILINVTIRLYKGKQYESILQDSLYICDGLILLLAIELMKALHVPDEIDVFLKDHFMDGSIV